MLLGPKSQPSHLAVISHHTRFRFLGDILAGQGLGLAHHRSPIGPRKLSQNLTRWPFWCSSGILSQHSSSIKHLQYNVFDYVVDQFVYYQVSLVICFNHLKTFQNSVVFPNEFKILNFAISFIKKCPTEVPFPRLVKRKPNRQKFLILHKKIS